MTNLDDLIQEVMALMRLVDVRQEGEHLWSNYQQITAIALRLTEIHNQIALEELKGSADASLKKFRTMIVDPSIERLDKTASYESRKITAKNIEANLER